MKTEHTTTSTTKKELLKICNGKNFYFTRTDSPVRGYNVRINVFTIDKRTKAPRWVGESDQNTASWYGDIAVARQIVSKAFNYKMEDSYTLARKDITVHQIQNPYREIAVSFY